MGSCAKYSCDIGEMTPHTCFPRLAIPTSHYHVCPYDLQLTLKRDKCDLCISSSLQKIQEATQDGSILAREQESCKQEVGQLGSVS